MPHSDEEIRRFKIEFAQKRRNQLLATIPLIAVLLIMVVSPSSLASLGLTKDTLHWGFILYILGVLGFSLTNWRCPACGRYLGRSFWIKFCPKCGVPLA